jgi:CysZ protein
MSAPGFFRGVFSSFRAMALLAKHPKLIGWLAIPFGITVLLDGALLYFAHEWLHDLIKGWMGDGWFGSIADLASLLLLLFFAFWSFTFIFMTACEVIIDFISEAVEEIKTGQAGNGPEGLAHTLRGIFISLQQVVVLLILQLLVLGVSFVPVVGQVLFFGFNIWALGYGMFSVPSGRKLHSLGARLSISYEHLRAVMGLGLVILVVGFIPVVNVLMLPVFVVAGTLLFLDTQARTEAPSKKSG